MNIIKSVVFSAFLAVQVIAPVFATDISQVPVGATSKIKPNVIFGLDDSGSMGSTYVAVGGTGTIIPDTPNPANTTQSEMSNWYNPLYYNPTITYTPWVKNTASGATYPNASTTGLRMWVSDGSAAVTSGTLSSGSTYEVTYAGGACTNSNYGSTYDFDTGAVFGSKNTCNQKQNTQYTLSSSYTVKAGQSWQKLTQVSSAIYYNLVAAGTCTVNTTTCFTAPVCTSASTCPVTPTGALLQKVTIALSDTAGLQNFANWQQYASTRHLLVGYSMSKVLPNLKGINIGVIPFNSTTSSNSITQGFDSSVASKSYGAADFAASGRMYNMDIPTEVDILLDIIYNTYSSSATPTHANMVAIGSSYMNKNISLKIANDTGTVASSAGGIVRFACQKNAAFILTDGYANESSLPSLPSGVSGYDQTIWGTGAPYATTYSKSLADIALGYFTTNIRSDYATGKVPVDTYTTGDGADTNKNLHMNTYALTLGAMGRWYNPAVDDAGEATVQFLGSNLVTKSGHGLTAGKKVVFAATTGVSGVTINTTYYVISSGLTASAFKISATSGGSAITINGTGTGTIMVPWIDPTTATNNPDQIDDLWHATINGRGQMFTATNTNTLITYVTNAMMDIILRAGSQAAVGVANVNMTKTNNAVYVSSYNANGWYGDVRKYTVDLTAISVDTSASVWSARDVLEDMDYTTRKIATWNGSAGVSFNASSTGYSAEVVAYLRGDRSNEPTGKYRQRTYLLGDIVNADPLVIEYASATVVYQAANDGMLHAFNAADGKEIWAYVPQSVLGNMSKLASPAYSHLYMVDGSPVSAMIGSTRILVGGLGAGGAGFYALDITSPDASSESAVAAKAKWEFPVSATDKANMGTSHSKPLILKTATFGQVVVISSGYNNTSGDGKGHIWFLNPLTGEVLAEIKTTDGSASAPIGMASLAGFAANIQKDSTATALYGGDELGNVWRFDITGAANTWQSKVKKIAMLKSATGVAQPVTTIPELTTDADQASAIVYIGTGRFLGMSDLNVTSQQTFYAIKDKLTNTNLPMSRTSMNPDVATRDWMKKDVSSDRLVSDQCSKLTGTAKQTCVDAYNAVSPKQAPLWFGWNTSLGWYAEFPAAGERITGNPVFAMGLINFNTNVVSATSCDAASYQYSMDVSGNGAGTLIGNYTVSRITLVVINNVVYRITVGTPVNGTTGAGTGTGTQVNITKLGSLKSSTRKISWKEITR